MKPSQAYPAQRTVARLDRERQKLEITQQDIADEASKTSRRDTVGITTVSKVLAYRTKSMNILAATSRLIAAKKRAAKKAGEAQKSVAVA